MTTKMRFLLCILLVAITITGLIGSPARAADKVKITLATWTGVDEAKELQGVIDKINAKSMGFEIVHSPIPQDYYTQIQTQLAGGTGADLLWLDQDHIASYADSGILMDISDRVAKADKGSAADLNDYFPDVLK